MVRLSFCVAFAVLTLAPVALADGPSVSPGVSYGWDGVASPSAGVRYVTLPANRNTELAVVRIRDGRVLTFWWLHGTWGVPLVTWEGGASGLSADGRTLVLADSSAPARQRFWTKSSFLLIDTKDFRRQKVVTLHGNFAFDALSPNGRMLYLIQHVSAADVSRYIVRAYDRDRSRLLPRAIADRTQRGWVMQGLPMTRATSFDGRWVYTLYQNPRGYPFVHALDTVRAQAHCIGIPWHGSQDALPNVRLSLSGDGQRLTLNWRSGRRLLAVDTRTFRIAYPARAHRFPWWIVGLSAGFAFVPLALGLLRVRARPRSTPIPVRTGAETA